jgi:ribose transport system substrate-binding protein
MKVVPDWKSAGLNPLPENIGTGVLRITKDNVAAFKHKS